MSITCHLDVICMRSYFIYMYSYAIPMSVVCTRVSSVCHSYVLISNLYVTLMYSHVICMSLVCHPYVTRMYSYVIRMSLICSVCHQYVTRMWFYHEPFCVTNSRWSDFEISQFFIVKNSKQCISFITGFVTNVTL